MDVFQTKCELGFRPPSSPGTRGWPFGKPATGQAPPPGILWAGGRRCTHRGREAAGGPREGEDPAVRGGLACPRWGQRSCVTRVTPLCVRPTEVLRRAELCWPGIWRPSSTFGVQAEDWRGGPTVSQSVCVCVRVALHVFKDSRFICRLVWIP